MSTGGTGGSFDYGAAAARPHVDLTDDDLDPKGAAAGYTPDHGPGKSLLGSLKDALRPGDTKTDDTRTGPGHAGDFTHDGRHGGIEETMRRGNRDYDDSDKGSRTSGGILDSVLPGRKDDRGSDWDRDRDRGSGSILDSVLPGRRDDRSDDRDRDRDRGSGGILDSVLPGRRDDRSDDRDRDRDRRSGGILDSVLPGRRDDRSDDRYRSDDRDRGSGSGILGKLTGADRDRDRDRDRDDRRDVSAFDREGRIGHPFTSEGAVGGTADKIGGPFSKDGAVGRQFTDSGAVGGTVQDTLGHGDATRKGR
ncbi:hypothetical protein GGR53DRAFT_530522 [Hypoxylon sp. FL1150]|nr:hypothetical protein GGR53DRAFT_530522 [Hypoxylon sp. FL1150]